MIKLAPLFGELLSKQATHLYLLSGRPPLVRVDQKLFPLESPAFDDPTLTSQLLSLLNAEQRSKLLDDLSLDFTYIYQASSERRHEQNGARFRARYRYGAAPEGAALTAVFELVRSRIESFSDLACPESVRKLGERRSGLLLFGGPTASACAPTIAALIDHINRTRACHVISIEETVDIVHEPERAEISQRELGVHTPTFVAALRNAMSGDPDVVHISNLGGRETVRAIFELTHSGVLVLAALPAPLPAPSAEGAISHVLSFFEPDEQPRVRIALADNLGAVVVQSFPIPIPNGKPLYEILLPTASTCALIREGNLAQLALAMQAAPTNGMQTMDMAVEKLLDDRKITPALALELCSDKEAIARSIARIRPEEIEGLSSYL